MPTYQYEAMDNTGLEIKETIDASSEAEAQQLIREKGFFVTKIQERDRQKKKEGRCRRREKEAGRPQGTHVRHRRREAEAAHHVHAATFDAAGRRTADPPQPANSRRAIEARPAQKLADERHRRH